MGIDTLLHHFAGYPVQRLGPDKLPAQARGVAWRLTLGPEDRHLLYTAPLPANPEGRPLGELLFEPLERWDQTPHIQALVVSCWAEPPTFGDSDSEEAAAALVALAPRLTSLEALFFGDIPRFMSDLAYIQQSDLGALMRAFPKLKTFGVRGGFGLFFSDLRHDTLEHLEIQTGGLRGESVRDITQSHLPRLRRLDLWLGADYYGGDAAVDDLAPIFSGKLFPALTHLGLQNTELSDGIAQALAGAPVMEQLTRLDLSMGTLTDAGAEALLRNPALARLDRLDVSDNYLSSAMTQRLLRDLPTIEIVTGTQKNAEDNDDERYVTHSE